MHPESSEISLIGRVIQDRFRIISRLAEGGMGAVYIAEQVPLGRKVALKVLEPANENRSGRLQFEERFFLEANAVAKLSHPNTIVLYDYGRTDDGHYFYAMELVQGMTLGQSIHEHRAMPSRVAIHIAAQICSSLREAHGAGLVHRDLKPGNIMITQRGDDPYFVKVLDFGLVKVVGDTPGTSDLTRSGIVMGSPRYMAPEQVKALPVDHRADIYSFGGVLYHMLAGGAPFEYESTFDTLRAQVDHAPPPITAKNPWSDASPRLTQLVFRCQEKDPAARPQSMAEVAAELRACAAEAGVGQSSLSLSGIDPISVSIASSERALPAQTGAQSGLQTPSVVQSHIASQSGQQHSFVQPMPQPAPASRLPMFLAAAVILFVAVGAGAVAFLVPFTSDRPAERTEAPPPPRPEPQPLIATPPPIPPPTPVQATTTEIISEPAGAHVQRGDEDLGDAPVTLRVPAGESWHLTLSLAGHEPRTITVTSAQPTVRVSLAPVPEARPIRPAVTRPNTVVQQPTQPRVSVPQQPTWSPPRTENRDPWGR